VKRERSTLQTKEKRQARRPTKFLHEVGGKSVPPKRKKKEKAVATNGRARGEPEKPVSERIEMHRAKKRKIKLGGVKGQPARVGTLKRKKKGCNSPNEANPSKKRAKKRKN